MESDRELLEMAARAAGLDIVWNPPEHPVAGWHCATGESWDALLDDGDALRLAVKTGEPFVVRTRCVTTMGGLVENFDPAIPGDDLRATRRAIVRSAAELGRRG